jgi:predicted ATP-binding protein involved in virulence
MFLRRIRLHNIKGIKDAEIDFVGGNKTRKWTVLVGDNGSGKSTFLKAVALLLVGSDGLLELVKNPADWVRYKQPNGFIEAELVTQRGAARSVRLVFDAKFSSSQWLRANTAGLEALDKALAHSSRNYFVVGYGATRRLGSAEAGLRGFEAGRYHSLRAQSVATLFDAHASLISLEDWALNLDYEQQQSDLALEVMQKVFDAMLPDVRFRGLDRRKRRLMFATEAGVVPLGSLSDGYQAAVAWIGDLLFRVLQSFGDYQSPLSARGLLIVDELDLHLHPRWQRRLFDFLDQHLPNMQILTTTHSPLTAQQLEAGSLFVLRRDQSGVKVEPFVGDPSTMLVNQLLMTDAFGLSTDESYRVQLQKERYRELLAKSRLNKSEQAEISSLKQTLTLLAEGGRSNQALSASQYELLQRLDAKLGGQS